MRVKPGGSDFFSRAEFSLNRKDYREEMLKLQAGCHQLRVLVDQRIGLANDCRKKTRRYNGAFLERVRRTAEDVYEGLMTSLSCKACEYRDIRLELTDRISSNFRENKGSNGEGEYFTFIVPYQASVPKSPAASLSFRYQIIRIQHGKITTASVTIPNA